jgi:hypothetical protein
LYSASGKKTCEFIESHNGLLRIEGVTWDSISSVGAALGDVISTKEAAILRSWHKFAETTLLLQDYISSGTLDNAFWRTLCMDCSQTSERTAERSKGNHRAAYDLWWQLTLKIDTCDSEAEVETILEPTFPTHPGKSANSTPLSRLLLVTEDFSSQKKDTSVSPHPMPLPETKSLSSSEKKFLTSFEETNLQAQEPRTRLGNSLGTVMFMV